MRYRYTACRLFILLPLCSTFVQAAEFKAHGLMDLRLTNNNSSESYLSGGHGKFSSNTNGSLSIPQLATELSVHWDSGVSGHLVINGYSENDETDLGMTEAYLKYKTVPSASGYRWQTKVGIFYPKISLENEAFAWASINTLNSSTLNTWIGEETKLAGTEVKFTRLGKFSGDPFDISITGSLFGFNDPSGALLSWHGWTMSNRQTLWRQGRPFPTMPASAPGEVLQHQSRYSNAFLEIDNRVGYHLQLDWKQHKKGKFVAGYYDNRAKPYIVRNGQYGWATKFAYVGGRWKLAKDLDLTAQYLTGSTLMQRPNRTDVVNNGYTNGFVSITKRMKKHRYTLRLEEFSVTDNDKTVGDNNEEYGRAATLNYTYRWSKPWFLSAEFNWIDSNRPSRAYTGQPTQRTEKQIQFAARYFF